MKIMTARITPAAELLTLPDDARMDAYYYGFDRTGVGPIDAILSAVATAGKGSHHTEGWGGDMVSMRDVLRALDGGAS